MQVIVRNEDDGVSHMTQIVLAEDGTDHARILIAILKKNGFEVNWFQTGVEAFDYLSKNPMPDLLITDVMMPGMSGFELLRRLKDLNVMPPTIVLTSKQREEDVLQGLGYGIIDYIVKPFSPGVVMMKIKNALVRKNAA